MSILSRFGRKNKKSEHYQRNYENITIKENDSVNIGIHSEGLVGNKQEEKKEYYRRLKEQITQSDIHTIESIFRVSKTVYEVFSKLENQRVPLDYLVAMDLVEEIDIEAYQNVKAKGLDVSQTESEEDLEDVDETLRMQVEGQSGDIPELKGEVSDQELGLVEKDDYVDEYQRVVAEMGSKEIKEGTTEHVEVKEEINITDEIIGEEHNEEVDEGTEEEVEEEVELEESDPDLNVFKSLAAKLGKKGKKEEKRERQKQEAREREKIKNIRDIYVIGIDLLLPVVEGYRIHLVKDMADIMEYTSSKRNLLIITQSIPRNLQGELMGWLRGINKGSSKYRIVTLKSSAVGHKLIEDKIELTEDSLNAYYEEYKDSDYEGKDVESFIDISEFIE